MRSPLLLTFRAYRKQPCWFVDHDDGIIQMNNFEAMALKSIVAHSLAYRNGHYVVRPQLGIMPDPHLALYRHRPEPEKVFRMLRDSRSGRLIRYGRSSHLEATRN